MRTRMTAAGATMNALIDGAGAASAGDWAGRVFDRLEADGDAPITATEARAMAAGRFARTSPGGKVTPHATTAAARAPLAKRI